MEDHDKGREGIKRTTRKEVARLAGVSTTAVTHVLQGNPKTRVSPETRKRILEIVRRTNYTPHAIASALNRRSTEHIAMVLVQPESAEYGLLSILMGACQETAKDFGYYLMTHELRERNLPDAGRELRQLIESGRADGLLIYKPDILSNEITFLHENQVPLVVLESTMPHHIPDLVAVTTDHHLGGSMAASHVLSLGHRSLGVITREYESIPDGYRPQRDWAYLTGVRDAASQWEKGPVNLHIVEGNIHDPARALRSIASLFEGSRPPTALLAADDTLAILALGYLQDRGIRVPDEVSVIGYNNAAFSRFTYPALTTINIPAQEIGGLAVQMLLKILRTETLAEATRLTLKPQLIVRGTCAAAKSALPPFARPGR